jgi:hypothetical protein
VERHPLCAPAFANVPRPATRWQSLVVYEVRGRPLLRCLIAPIGGGGILIPACFIALILVVVGGRVTVAAIAFLALYEWRAYALALRADANGIYVKNFFLRHRIPWRDVRGIWAPERAGSRELIPTLSIERRNSVFFSVSAYATLGLRREERRQIARELIGLARQNGYEVPGGSESEVNAQLEAMREAGLRP